MVAYARDVYPSMLSFTIVYSAVVGRTRFSVVVVFVYQKDVDLIYWIFGGKNSFVSLNSANGNIVSPDIITKACFIN